MGAAAAGPPAGRQMMDALRNHSYNWKSGIVNIVELVTEPNAIRARGNTTAHVFDPQDILEAVECLPASRDRAMLSELYDFLYGV